MKKLLDFVEQHLSDDTARLVLDKWKWPDIDMETAVNCIESRRKLKGKVQDWYDNPELIFPLKLSAEQCSSSATGNYKATLAERIASKQDWLIADLTGGLGVDSWYFSQKAERVFYNEMKEELCKAAGYNFNILGAGNITTSAKMLDTGKAKELLDGFTPDIIYMDPARRDKGGKKVFLLEDCTPDVLTLKDELFTICRHLLIKLSPMADITMVCTRLGQSCREVHIVSHEGECKELLIWMDREWNDGYRITAVELPSGYPKTQAASLTFSPSEEKESIVTLARNLTGYLFEPGKSLTKAGAFNITGLRFNMEKLGRSTHYYIVQDHNAVESLKGFGKVFRICSTSPLDKRSMKEVGKNFPKAEVTARNIPMTSDALRKKIGCNSGGEEHIFGLRSDLDGPVLIIGKRV